jgi:hypothetical protein
MIAAKPAQLRCVEAASVPVVGCTAYQMLFDHAGVQAGQTVVVLGEAGNVGGYAVQLACLAGARVVATARPPDLDLVRSLGAAEVVAAGEPRRSSRSCGAIEGEGYAGPARICPSAPYPPIGIPVEQRGGGGSHRLRQRGKGIQPCSKPSRSRRNPDPALRDRRGDALPLQRP